jgi:hypothetical protein
VALSKIDVCNQALLKVGADTIASLDTSSDLDEGTIVEANLCNIFFDQALEETMRVYPWNCCTARTVPVKLAEAPAFGYEVAFQLPNDCMRVINVFDSSDQDKNGIRWVIEGDRILCDYDVVYLKYVQKPTNVGVLDPLAIRALICNLALKLAIPLQLDDKQAARILAELEQVVLPMARSIDTFENKELLREESSWITSRYTDRPNY